MRKLRNIARFLLAFLVGGYLCLLALLHFDPLQRRLTNFVASSLAEELHTEVSIGEVEVGLFNRVVLHDVLVKDQYQKELLRAKSLAAKIQLAPLFEGRISLRTVSLIEGNITLYQRKKAEEPNYQFILDAFKSEDKQDASALDLRINSIILRRCKVSYDKWYLPETPSQFNLSHLHLSRLDANASLKALQRDSINVRLRFLSFQEKSGLDVRSLSFKFAATPQQAYIEEFALRMPNSSLSQEGVKLRYDLKDFFGTLVVSGRVGRASLATADVAPFLPQLHHLNRQFILNTDYKYSQRRLTLNDFLLSESKGQFRLSGDFIARFQQGRKPWFNASAFSLYAHTALGNEVMQVLTGKTLPQQVLALKEIRLNGRAHYDIDGRSTITSEIFTPHGTLEVDATLWQSKLSGVVNGKGVNLAAILNNAQLPKDVYFHLNATDITRQGSDYTGLANLQLSSADFKGYTYHDLTVKAKAQAGQIALQAESSDPHLNFSVKGSTSLRQGQLGAASVVLDVRRVVPAVLGWTERFGRSAFGFKTELKTPRPTLANLQGEFHLNDFSMTEGEEQYRLNHLSLVVTPQDKGKRLTLRSDFADADIEGRLDIPHIRTAVLALTEKILPGVLPRRIVPRNYAMNDAWRFDVRLLRDDFFQRMLHLPVKIDGTMSVQGSLHTDDAPTAIRISGDGFAYAGYSFQHPLLTIEGEGTHYQLKAQTQTVFKKTDLQLFLTATADSGRLNTSLAWDDIAVHRYSGSLSAQTYSQMDESGSRRTITALQPSQLRVRDTLWTVSGGNFSLVGKSFQVDRFRIAYRDHSLLLHGSVSPNGADSLEVALHKMDIDYILSLVNFSTLRFQGLATGRAVLTLPDGQPNVAANLEVDSLYMNDGLLGHTHLKGGYDSPTKRILLDADITEGTVGDATVRGYVSPAHKRLDLAIENRNLRANFLQRYVSSIFTDLDARATGNFRVAGTFQDIEMSGSQDFSGDVYVSSLGVAYHATRGHVEATPRRFVFRDVEVTDADGGRGTISGVVDHDYLRNMSYRFEGDVHNLYVYNQPSVPELPYFAQAYGTGHISMNGKPGAFNADISLRPERKSYVTYKADARDDGAAVPFLTFRDRDSIAHQKILAPDLPSDPIFRIPSILLKPQATAAATDIRLNFHIDANPDAELRVIMDQKAGDNIVLRGEGGLNASYYNKGAFQVYGTYNVLGGTYRMTIQEFLKKDFTFTGGSLTFSGEPFQAGLDLQAVYVVPAASLAGLYSGTSLSENNVKVNCLLNIGGRAASPQVTFDLDLPTADSEVKQLVRNMINTQNDMNMQVLYLLGFGRFYSYNSGTVVAGAGQSQSMVAMKSFLSSTLTNQLNDILSNALGTSDWSFGTNISTGDVGWSDVEVEGVLRGSLFNNRLQLNGNFGYRDRALSTRTSNFVGDFDIRYLLSPRGGVALKAYSTTNERYFTRSSLTTQGLGIMFRKDFSNLRDLFRRKRKAAKAVTPEKE